MKLLAKQRVLWTSVPRTKKLLAIILASASAFLALACQHIGPGTVPRDRLAYNEAVSTSWKEQILLNIVRLRYHDMADFVDVGTIQQSHTLMGTVSGTLSSTLNPWNIVTSTLSPSVTGGASTTDNPSVTYAPQSGSDFTRNLIAPIKPYELFNLIEDGYHNVMRLAVVSIDGIPNDPKDRDFKDVTRAISDGYLNGDVSFPVEMQPDGNEKKIFMIVPEQDSTSEASRDSKSRPPIVAIRQILHLKPAATRFEIKVGTHPKTDTEIAVRTHSVISAMIRLSDYVPRSKQEELARVETDPPLTVHIGSNKPSNAYAAVKYQGNWFWIDQGDRRSNQAVVYLRTMLALADTGARPTAPVLTIPASR